MNKLTVPLTSSFCIIQVTAHTSWGWYKSTLKVSFHVLIHSMLNYAAPAWCLWLFGINLSCLDHLQNHALRLVTVHLVSTSFEGQLLEANVQSCHTYSNWLILRAREKAPKRTDDQPKCVALDANVPQRLSNYCSFHRRANILSTISSSLF